MDRRTKKKSGCGRRRLSLTGMWAAVALFLLPWGGLRAQDAAADSVDVLHYGLTLDMGNRLAGHVYGEAEITFRLTRACSAVTFDLICDTVWPVSLDGVVIRGYNYNRDERQLRVHLNGGEAGGTHVVTVPYVTQGYVESYGWGGLHIDDNIHYSLGVAFREYPHVFGRCWFPCRDNFYDKASYTLTVTSKPSWRAICGGVRQSETANPDGSSTSVWHIWQPTPTYLVSVSSAPWRTIERTYEGHYGNYPALIGYTTQDSARVARAYGILEEVLPAYERAFGPYRWDRIGYIATPKGSMEHVSNIGLAASCMDTLDAACQMVVCHELGHAWFGNLVTCASAADMWINEGGATFCEEVATEGAFGVEAADQYYQDKLSAVLRTAHLDDGGWRPLSGMPEYYTYGTTTYQKGAMVWHSLRGLMGDSLFRACMHRLFANGAFGVADAASLRDSLSLYSGLDLGGFFDFHVFGTGSVDYSVEGLEVVGNCATLTLRQLLRGADRYARGNRVPVTFYSATLRQSQQWMVFDDSAASQTFLLPFKAAFAVVDPGHLISDACTDGSAALTQRGIIDLPHAFCKIGLSQPSADSLAWAHVGLHYARPISDSLPGVARMADRYWQVTGRIPWDEEVQGRFLYNLGASNAAGASGLDMGFYDRRQTLDSLALLYRPGAGQPWQMVSRQRAAGSSAVSGYFVARLLPGQYTLAVVDTAVVGIERLRASAADGLSLRVAPNPNHSEFRILVEGCDKKFEASVFDAGGKKVLQMHDLHSGDTVRHHLAKGTYLLLIQNNFISLQSQIVVQ